MSELGKNGDSENAVTDMLQENISCNGVQKFPDHMREQSTK